MTVDGLSDDTIRDILLNTRRIAVVGASANPARASNEITGFLVQRGFDVTPVNPGLAGQRLHGVEVAPSLEAAGPLDMVDIFRRSEEAGKVVDEAIRLGAKTVWMQLGVIDEAAGERARAAGLVAVMDRCPLIEWRRLRLATGA
ncbi:CoA binding domain protein [Acetobacteraceae bacterium AT-5844]|nr:CoA binding domain protein [Acetobacteraceae bacterium AT-5844]